MRFAKPKVVLVFCHEHLNPLCDRGSFRGWNMTIAICARAEGSTATAAADCRWKHSTKDRQTRKDHRYDSGWSWRHGDHACEVGVSKTPPWRWQEYFAQAGVEGLVKGRSKPPGRKPISAAIKLKVVEKTVKERPVNATHWSVRTMAKEMGISHTSVQRIWAEHALKPHL